MTNAGHDTSWVIHIRTLDCTSLNKTNIFRFIACRLDYKPTIKRNYETLPRKHGAPPIEVFSGVSILTIQEALKVTLIDNAPIHFPPPALELPAWLSHSTCERPPPSAFVLQTTTIDKQHCRHTLHELLSTLPHWDVLLEKTYLWSEGFGLSS